MSDHSTAEEYETLTGAPETYEALLNGVDAIDARRKSYQLPRRAPVAYQYPPLPRRVYVAAVVRELWWLGVAVGAAGVAIARVWGAL